ncbi:MAG: hypothetical protein NVSMB28_21010 [Collimonas sp.]
MATVTFDTLKFVRTLEAAGISFSQAEAFSDAVRDSHEGADVATKRDVDDVRKDMQAMEARIDAKFEKFELRLTVKLGSIVVFALGAFAVLSKWIA